MAALTETATESSSDGAKQKRKRARHLAKSKASKKQSMMSKLLFGSSAVEDVETDLADLSAIAKAQKAAKVEHTRASIAGTENVDEVDITALEDADLLGEPTAETAATDEVKTENDSSTVQPEAPVSSPSPAPTTAKSQLFQAARKKAAQRKMLMLKKKQALEKRQRLMQAKAAKRKAEQSEGVVKKAKIEKKSPVSDSLVLEDSDWWKRSDSKEEPDTTSSTTSSSTSVGADFLEFENDEKGKYVPFFWFDAFESYNNPGTVYLFGKVKAKNQNKLASCCVQISGLERVLYFLPRKAKEGGEPVELTDVWKEVSEVFRKQMGQGNVKFRSRVTKKRYAFELEDVPREETEYMEIRYSASLPRIKGEVVGATFSRVFGTTASVLENFILGCDLMGPGWLKIRDPEVLKSSASSWCKYNMKVGKARHIRKMTNAPPSPQLTVCSLSIKTVVNPSTHQHEVVMVSCLTNDAVSIDGPTKHPNKLSHFSILRQPRGTSIPLDFKQAVANSPRWKGHLTVTANERGLLNYLMAKLAKMDPDVIVGHNIIGFTLDVLLTRMQACKVAVWSKIGRMRMRKIPSYNRGRDIILRNTHIGRLMCDVYLSAREFVRETSYSLTALARNHLDQRRRDIEPLDVPQFFNNNKQLLALTQHTENDAWLALNIMFKLEVLPLTKQLTNLSGNLWSHSMLGKRAERIEFLLLHEFFRLGYMLPDKQKKFTKGTRKRGKAEYAGGLVLEPKKGLYDKHILLLDFKSLYPSIIQEFNICFTTVKRTAADLLKAAPAQVEHEDDALAPAPTKNVVPDVPAPDLQFGVLPRVIQQLVQRRSEVKRLMKREQNDAKKKNLNVRQLALKILANSMYGCLGFSHSRFYAKPLAALVTYKGREILQDTVEMATGLGYDVIYGDTDSIMINTGCEDLATTKKIGRQLMKEYNKKYKLIEIEIDGVYKMMLLLKKKKYAALTITENNGKIIVNRELKGLDMVRRDWCPLSKDIGHKVLDHILSGDPIDSVLDAVHTDLAQAAKDIRAGQIPLDKFIITKGLNKAPHEYPNSKGQPHVNVAQKMVARGLHVNIGDHIPYVICKGEGNQIAARARHPDVVARSEGKLELDIEWYLGSQVLPPISRLCAVIDGTSTAAIAECLGLDSSKYHAQSNNGDGDDWGFAAAHQMEDEERFKQAEPLVLSDKAGAKPTPFAGILCFDDDFKSAKTSSLPGSQILVTNQMRLQQRQHVKRYYDAWMKCDDPACGVRSRQLRVKPDGRGQACVLRGCRGTMRPEYDSPELFTQLKYFSTLFDVPHARKRVHSLNKRRRKDEAAVTVKLPMKKQALEPWNNLKVHADQCLNTSAYYTLRPSLWSYVFGESK